MIHRVLNKLCQKAATFKKWSYGIGGLGTAASLAGSSEGIFGLGVATTMVAGGNCTAIACTSAYSMFKNLEICAGIKTQITKSDRIITELNSLSKENAEEKKTENWAEFVPQSEKEVLQKSINSQQNLQSATSRYAKINFGIQLFLGITNAFVNLFATYKQGCTSTQNGTSIEENCEKSCLELTNIVLPFISLLLQMGSHYLCASQLRKMYNETYGLAKKLEQLEKSTPVCLVRLDRYEILERKEKEIDSELKGLQEQKQLAFVNLKQNTEQLQQVQQTIDTLTSEIDGIKQFLAQKTEVPEQKEIQDAEKAKEKSEQQLIQQQQLSKELKETKERINATLVELNSQIKAKQTILEQFEKRCIELIKHVENDKEHIMHITSFIQQSRYARFFSEPNFSPSAGIPITDNKHFNMTNKQENHIENK